MAMTFDLSVCPQTPKGCSLLPPKTVAHYHTESRGHRGAGTGEQPRRYLGKEEELFLKEINISQEFDPPWLLTHTDKKIWPLAPPRPNPSLPGKSLA